MKIAILSSSIGTNIGGIERVAYELIQQYTPDHDVIAIAGNEQSYAKTNVFIPDLLSRNVPKIMWNLLKHTSDLEIDVIHALDAQMGIFATLLGKYRNIPVIVTVHGSDYLSAKSFLKKTGLHILKYTSGIYADANSVMAILRENGLPVTNFVPLAVDTKFFSPDKKDPKLRKKLGLPNDAIVMVSVSRLSPRKGLDRIMDAVKSALETMPNLYYVAVGSGEDEQMLKNHAKSLGIETHVIFAGRVPTEQLPHYLTSADFYILLDGYDKDRGDINGFGLSYLEANACGLPVIAPSEAAALDIIEQNLTGILVKNHAETVSAIIELAKDPSQRRYMGSAAHDHVTSNYTWDKTRDAYLSIYEHAISTHATKPTGQKP